VFVHFGKGAFQRDPAQPGEGASMAKAYIQCRETIQGFGENKYPWAEVAVICPGDLVRSDASAVLELAAENMPYDPYAHRTYMNNYYTPHVEFSDCPALYQKFVVEVKKIAELFGVEVK
jgi:hypothetical protein